MQQGVVAVSHEFGKNTNIRDDQKKQVHTKFFTTDACRC